MTTLAVAAIAMTTSPQFPTIFFSSCERAQARNIDSLCMQFNSIFSRCHLNNVFRHFNNMRQCYCIHNTSILSSCVRRIMAASRWKIIIPMALMSTHIWHTIHYTEGEQAAVNVCFKCIFIIANLHFAYESLNTHTHIQARCRRVMRCDKLLLTFPFANYLLLYSILLQNAFMHRHLTTSPVY